MVRLGRQTALTRQVFHTVNGKRDNIIFMVMHFVSACDLGNSQHVIRSENSLHDFRLEFLFNFFHIHSADYKFIIKFLFFVLASRHRIMHRCLCVSLKMKLNVVIYWACLLELAQCDTLGIDKMEKIYLIAATSHLNFLHRFYATHLIDSILSRSMKCLIVRILQFNIF